MNFILTRDKAITIAPAALKLSGIPDDAKLELTTLDGAVILTRSKMTAMEYVKLLTELTAHVGQMLLTLRDTCGHCDECDEDECACRDLPIEELIRPAVTVPDWAREEADIPSDAKLGCYVDEDSGEITVCETDYKYDLSDVPPAILFALRQSGCCLSVLEDVLMENDSGVQRIEVMTQMNETYLYRGSAKEAKRRDELPLWRESHKANIACREAIEDAIRRNFDGINLDPECLTPVLEEYGYKRTEWVLAATLRELKWDGRFRPANKDWATRHHVPQDERHIADITVRSHPAVLDGFVGLYRKAYQKLGLFGSEHCIGDRAEQDYTGKVLVLSPDTLKESYWSQENQLWYAHDGFGCSPTAIGRSVRCTCLGDGEMTRWNRDEFIGVLDEKFLPEWAQEKLAELTAPRQEESAMGEMKLE